MSSLFQYRSLFQVNLLIDYYLSEESGLFQDTPDNPMETVLEQQRLKYDVSRDLDIRPTSETIKSLKDKRLIFKRNKTGFFVSSQVSPLGDGTYNPFLTLNNTFSLRFEVQLNNPYFYNFTNISLEGDLENKDHYIYYFSNRVNNIDSNNRLYLSEPLPDFDSNYAYEASEVIIDRSNPVAPIMREAIENNGPGVFNNANWRDIFTDQDPLFQFASNADRIVTRPFIFKHKVLDAAQENLVITIRDFEGNISKTTRFNSPEFGTPLRECDLDLRVLNAGLYALIVEDTIGTPFPDLSLKFYLDDTIHQNRPLALIECFHEPDGSLGAYRWLDNNNQDRLRFPEYVIRWKNRSTWWRYYFESAPNLTSAVLENLDPVVNAPNNRILISTTPLALTQVGREISANLGNGDLQLFPNPNIQMIYPENGRIFSELNMGGGIGPPE
nr:hypothetical protein [uncultured Psychroserpens sp.]